MVENTTTYLTVLLSDNENLKNMLTTYLNTKISLESTYSDVKTDLSKLIKPEEKKQMIDAISLFRAYATRIKISLSVIKDKFDSTVFGEIISDYNVIKTEALPSYDVCERFVQNVNDVLGEKMNVAATFTSQA